MPAHKGLWSTGAMLSVRQTELLWVPSCCEFLHTGGRGCLIHSLLEPGRPPPVSTILRKQNERRGPTEDRKEDQLLSYFAALHPSTARDRRSQEKGTITGRGNPYSGQGTLRRRLKLQGLWELGLETSCRSLVFNFCGRTGPSFHLSHGKDRSQGQIPWVMEEVYLVAIQEQRLKILYLRHLVSRNDKLSFWTIT